MNTKGQHMETPTDVVSFVSASVTKAGAVGAVYGGYTANEIVAFGGLAIAVLSFIYNIWHTSKMRKIARLK